jgi:hypothetical protein
VTLVDVLLALLLSVPAPAAPVVVQVPEEVAEVPVLPEHAATLPEPAAAPTPRPPAPAVPPFVGPVVPPAIPCDESSGLWVLVADEHGVWRCRPTAEVDKGD